MKTLQNFINGKFVASKSGKTSELINPATGKVFATAPVSNLDDVNLAMKSAADAFVIWRDSTPSERQRALLKIADALEAKADQLIAIEVENCGKPIGLTKSEEIPPMIDQIRFFAGAARVLEGRGAGEYMAGHTSYVRREPIGVCGAVTPWNYPMMMAVWKWAPALAAGNTMVIKPSDTTPVSTLFMAEVIAGILPAGVLNVVCGDRDTGRALVEHDIPSMVSITGSVRAGMEVAGSAAKDLKRVHLELGGKAPIVVFDDADIAAAAEWLAIAGFFNAGQDCTAATRVLVSDKIHDDFVAALADQAKNTATTIEGGITGEGFVPPVNNSAQLEKVLGFIDRTPKHATIQAGGNRQNSSGFYIEPTVVAGLKQDDEMIQNEVFASVQTIQTFKDEADAIRMSNDVAYGLAASIWSEDINLALDVASQHGVARRQDDAEEAERAAHVAQEEEEHGDRKCDCRDGSFFHVQF